MQKRRVLIIEIDDDGTPIMQKVKQVEDILKDGIPNNDPRVYPREW